MKMCVACASLVALIGGTLLAEPVDVNGRFRSATPGGFPDGWVLHQWTGYKPWPSVRSIAAAEEGKAVLSISNVRGDEGGAIQTRAKFPACSGTVGRATFLARGKGWAWVTFYRWGAKGEWNGVVVSSPIALSRTWQPHVVTLPVDNGPACETRAVSLAVGGKRGAEIELSELTLELQPPRIVGDTRLPRSWTIFAPVEAAYRPTADELRAVPQRLGGVEGRAVSLVSESLRFAPAGRPGEQTCRWAFGTLAARYDCDMTVAAGGDAALQYYLNGELVFDLPAPANAFAAEPAQRIKTVRLRAGTNVIAVRSAGGGGVVRLAGPLDLRGAATRLRLVRPTFEEGFEGRSVRCSGEPLLIKGHPTPGLLSITGQGVFRTNATLAISCPGQAKPPAEATDGGAFAAAGLRIQDFGRDAANRQDAALEIVAADLTCRISFRKDAPFLTLAVCEGDRPPQTVAIAAASLPADFLFGVNGAGRWTASVYSLVDSKRTTLGGQRHGPPPAAADFGFRLVAAGAPAEATLDNLVVGVAVEEAERPRPPFDVELAPRFDPQAAGWKKVFDDGFDGSGVDAGKWHFSPTSEKAYAKVHDGALEIVCDWATADKTKTKSASLYTNEVFGHGYFEARVKFRQQPGWWSAFWLCTHGPSNPFLDGWEIDIYEDYYMGAKNPGEAPRGILDHNLHVFACGTLRSWNYGSKLPGGVDDWYVVACKWTPFEVSYYLNGALIESTADHSPYGSVTFDPINHAAGFVPLHAIVSGCCGKSGGDATKGKFPESFFVDYVRIYEFPRGNGPTVRLLRKPDTSRFILKPGEELRFEAQIEPSPRTAAKIKHVYLFDSGALLDHRAAPPYDFVVKIAPDYYDGTHFVRPGRSGIRPDWDRGLHAFCIFAQDDRGNVGWSENVVKLLRKNGKTAPYLGKTIQLPGRIELSHYDEGGQGFAYSDGTPGNNASKTFRVDEDVDAGPTVIGGVSGGEWLKYTVHVARTANYTFTLEYGTPFPDQQGPRLMIDCQAVGDFRTPAHQHPDWRHTSKAVLRSVPLGEGAHEIVVLMRGAYNLGGLNVEAE